MLSRLCSGTPPAYWARHFACALDMFEVITAAFQHGQITTEGGAMISENSRVLFPFVKKTLRELMNLELRQGERPPPLCS